ncbi:MAG: helicase-associated domain-containing protein, partial [Treponema sp.]|nr:helicase-associated domain-containing protein [Treponema sp.]
GLTLQELLPLVKFLELVKYDKVMSFEMNKKAVMRSFDYGMTAESIKATISEYTDYPIPQNMDVTLDEWFGSYGSASLYKGYVLKVSGENDILVKRNRFLSHHIIDTLGPGLYLLDFSDDIMAQAAIKQCGLDFIGKIKSKETEKFTSSSFFSLDRNDGKLPYGGEDGGKGAAAGRPLKKEQDELLESLREKVNAMRIPQEQKDGLLSRIDRRVIVNEDQLRPESVRFEKLEALAMDYQGKVHVIENSILAKCLVEITSSEGDGIFLGEVTSFTKYEGEAEVTLKREDGTERTFSVSKASLVRKVIRQLTF